MTLVPIDSFWYWTFSLTNRRSRVCEFDMGYVCTDDYPAYNRIVPEAMHV